MDNYAVIGNTLYFKYSSTTGGNQLAKYDGNTLTTIAKATANDQGCLDMFTVVGSTLYYWYSKSTGINLAKYDGNTQNVIPNVLTSDYGYAGTYTPIIIGTDIHFTYYNAEYKVQLAKYDGSTLTVFANPSTADGGFFDGFKAENVIGNTLYAQYYNASGRTQLAKYDGNTLTVIPNVSANDRGFVNSLRIHKFGDNVYANYQINNFNIGGVKTTLAKYDGNTLSVVPFKSANDLSISLFSKTMTIGSDIYVLYRNSASKSQLAKYDGSTLTLIANPQTADNGFQINSIEIGNNFYFVYSSTANKYQLAKYDGNTLTLIPNIAESDNGISYPSDPISHNNTLYFQYSSATLGGQLAKYDGNALSIIPEVQVNDYFDNVFYSSGNTLYYKYYSSTNAMELAVIKNGTTKIIRPSATERFNSFNLPIKIGETLYFKADNFSIGTQQLLKYTDLDYITWTGTTSTAWETASNWNTNTVPTATDDVVIPLVANAPTASTPQTIKSLTINLGATLNIGTSNYISATSTLTNNGIIGGLGILSLTGTSPQTISGTGIINNLAISNATGTTVTSGAGNMQSIAGVLAPIYGVLTTNGNITLKSSALATASIAYGVATIANSNGTISGNIVTERYIPSNNRKRYTLVGSPVSGATIKAAWQENGATISGYGTHITNRQTTNGFDGPNLSSASIFTYDDSKASGSKWTALANTDVNTLSAGKGYLLYVRGDRSENRPVTGNSSNTVLRATGTVTAGSFTTTGLITGANKYNLIANPYACAIDWLGSGVTKTQLSNFFSVYDPNLGVFISSNGTNITPAVATQQQARYIQSGQAFFIQNDNTGTAPSLTIPEAAKVTSIFTNSGATVFGTGDASAKLAINIYRTQDSSFADGAVALFGNKYQAVVDAQDAAKFSNFSETFGLRRGNNVLGLEARPSILKADTLFCNLSNFGKRDYKLVIDGSNFTNANATLEDRYTANKTTIDIAGKTTYGFTVNADSLSSSNNRFIITFGSTIPATVVTNAPALFVKVSPNPVSEQLLVSFKNATVDVTTINIMNTLGQIVKTVNAGKVDAGNITIPVSSLASGTYTVQLLSGTKLISTQKVIKN